MHKNLYRILFVAMLSVAPPAHAAMPVMPEIPTTLPNEVRQPLIAKRQPLADKKLALIDEADRNKNQCTNIVVGSEQHRTCLEMQKDFNARVEILRSEFEQLADEIDAAVEKNTIKNFDPMVVDARNVPSGLPKSVEDAIPRTPSGERVRKGFQAVTEHDWKVALAWFQDALNHEPESPGLRRLVDLAQYTLQRQSKPPAKPAGAAAPIPAGKADNSKTGMNPELYRSMEDYYTNHPPKFLKPGKAVQSDTEWLNEKEPAWKNFFRMLTPKLKIDKDGKAVIFVGIRG